MAVELMMGSSYMTSNRFPSEESTVEEAASAGLQSVEKLIKMLQQRQTQQDKEQQENPDMEIDLDCRAVADVAVNKFKKVISLLGRTRTGHARFRRGPVAVAASNSPPKQNEEDQIFQTHQINQEIKINPSSATRVYCPTPIQRYPPLPSHHMSQNPQFSLNMVQQQQQNGKNISNSVCEKRKEPLITTINFTSPSAATTTTPSISATTNSFMSSLTGDTDTSSMICRQPSSSSGFQITGRPPLSSNSSKRKCMSSDDAAATKCVTGTSGKCHCSKRKKSRVMKRVVRVPAISLRMADIPPDDYSWRKYGQKPIKGSPHPRGYYRCSSLKNCPARKHVERALDDSTMLIITYEGDHNHSRSITDAAPLILESS